MIVLIFPKVIGMHNKIISNALYVVGTSNPNQMKSSSFIDGKKPNYYLFRSSVLGHYDDSRSRNEENSVCYSFNEDKDIKKELYSVKARTSSRSAATSYKKGKRFNEHLPLNRTVYYY